MKTSQRLLKFLVLAVLTAPASMSFAAVVPPAPVVASRAPEAPGRTPAPDYAAREIASAPKLESFRGGGGGIYIGGSAVAILLIVILVVILL